MIIFSDFDKTLFFRDAPSKTLANIAAIKKWRAAGHQFVIITGRSRASLLRATSPDFLNLCDYAILDGGSVICNHQGQILYTASIEPAAVAEITRRFRHFSAPSVPLYYTPTSEGATFSTSQVTKLRFWFHDTSHLLEAIALTRGLPLQAFTCHDATPSIHPELAHLHAFIEIVPENAGKASAIHALVQLAHLHPTGIITIGDGENDRDMLTDFHGYMVAGSHLARSGAGFALTDSLSALIYEKLEV